MLLQIDAMSDATFTLKDVIYIVGIVLPLAGIFFNLKASAKSVDEKIKNFELKQKDDCRLIHKRIEKTQEEQKEYTRQTDGEFKEINEKLQGINLILGEIKGLLKK